MVSLYTYHVTYVRMAHVAISDVIAHEIQPHARAVVGSSAALGSMLGSLVMEVRRTYVRKYVCT